MSRFQIEMDRWRYILDHISKKDDMKTKTV